MFANASQAGRIFLRESFRGHVMAHLLVSAFSIWIPGFPLLRAHCSSIYICDVPELDFASINKLHRLMLFQTFAVHGCAMCCAEVDYIQAACGTKSR